MTHIPQHIEGVELIRQYFPELTASQVEQFRQLEPIYREWNAKVNLISRKDFHNFYTHHVLHSLSIAKAVNLPSGSHVLDIGTGGGFPGIPMAIFFPDVRFTLVDSIAKKVHVVEDVIRQTGLSNATALRERVENLKGQFDFAVSRAVKPLPRMWKWVKKTVIGGIIALKGGDLHQELEGLPLTVKTIPISRLYDIPWFEGKYVVIAVREANLIGRLCKTDAQ